MKKILFVGLSGSGKSVGAVRLAASNGKQTYILNGTSKDKSVKPISWTAVEQLTDANLICEGKSVVLEFAA